ncbi:MAG: DNA alkylation repair protein [Lachnospiraceae bacterium]|nr:DNA alkylation repair protein [Lachnospiraceae bacterium]
MDIQKEIEGRLFALEDKKYKEFHSKLMPTINQDTIIGVRTPAMRKLAKELAKQPEYMAYIHMLPHNYYDENNLHGFLIEAIKDYEECVSAVNEFLPYVDNWATCDSMSPKVFKKHRPELLEQIKIWMASEHTYTIRYGIGMLMTHFLDENFEKEYLEWVARIRSEEYYVNMMIAWYFATALAKQPEATLPYIEQKRLDVWTHNKAIQKAVESFRVTKEQKEYLRTLRVRKS